MIASEVSRSLPHGLDAIQSPHDAALKTEQAMWRACTRIAPTWPLDRFIAVNPLWERTGEPLPQVAAELAALSGSRLLMPRAWYREEWRAGRLRADELRAVVARNESGVTEAELMRLLASDEPAPLVRARVMDVADARRNLQHELSWREFVVFNTSQYCAAYFDEAQAQVRLPRDGGLYGAWRRQACADDGPRISMGFADFRAQVLQLPETPLALAQQALAGLRVPEVEVDNYLTSLLLDLNGWAAWCAYRRWSARLQGTDDDHLLHLLAIRLAWEWLLLRAQDSRLSPEWQRAISHWPACDAAAKASQAHDWVLQEALEASVHRQVGRELSSADGAAAQDVPPKVQAVFCIDVRSEPFRRAFEAESPAVQTIGFAGFFGLPISYRPLAAAFAGPLLPALLAPRFSVTDTGAPLGLLQQRTARLGVSQAWQSFKTSALSSFSFVEAIGPAFAGSLLKDSFTRSKAAPAELAGLSRKAHAALQPRLSAHAEGAPLEASDRSALAFGMLQGMGLTRHFAELVVFIGHGTETRNNPHRAGLDCGACGGRPGEINARVAAALVNDPEVRKGLSARGITIPDTTHFLAGLHNTTTDEVDLYDIGELPSSHRARLNALTGWLLGAGARARKERAPKLGPPGLATRPLLDTLRARARNWAELRPEWGLADNSSFIIAPRARSKHINLGGRSFLHDYRYREDPDFTGLARIMTAPMLVAHWINFQYYASTVDPARYGSGNKTLHNVVGGHLGVFEGNGGDLRIGLPLQSVHDGTRFVHTPVRLGVFIEAPRSAIADVLAQHAQVRQLVENAWLRLYCIEDGSGNLYTYRDRYWERLAFDAA